MDFVHFIGNEVLKLNDRYGTIKTHRDLQKQHPLGCWLMPAADGPQRWPMSVHETFSLSLWNDVNVLNIKDYMYTIIIQHHILPVNHIGLVLTISA
jgi:hypothetical protein